MALPRSIDGSLIMGIGPMVNAMCERCAWSRNTHNTDVRKFGVECMVHLDAEPTHTIVWGIVQ